MVTQKIVTRLSNADLPPVRMVSGDIGREIQLEIYASEESLAPINLETYHASITIIKPDNTFVIQDFTTDKVELPEQAGAVTGHGYYQIKIYTTGDHQIYTGQGAFIVDDEILSDEMIESIAEVNGYQFPDDFLTEYDLREYVKKYELEDAIAGIIEDDETALNSTWSSSKISEALSNVGTNYSTTEKVVGKWIDGTTDVYERTFQLENVAAVGDWTAFDTIAGMSHLISKSIVFTRSNGQEDSIANTFDIAFNPPNAPGALCYYPGPVASAIITIRYIKGV